MTDRRGANPMLHKPLSEYAKTLLSTIEEEYNDLPFNRSNKPEFMTKRMNLPEVDRKSNSTMERNTSD